MKNVKLILVFILAIAAFGMFAQNANITFKDATTATRDYVQLEYPGTYPVGSGTLANRWTIRAYLSTDAIIDPLVDGLPTGNDTQLQELPLLFLVGTSGKLNIGACVVPQLTWQSAPTYLYLRIFNAIGWANATKYMTFTAPYLITAGGAIPVDIMPNYGWKIDPVWSPIASTPAVDYEEGVPTVVAPGITFTLDGGNGNSAADVVPPAVLVGVNVDLVIYDEVVELLGSGPWTLVYQTAAPEGAWYSYVTGEWTTVPNVGGFITFVIPAGGKDIPEVPIILGDGGLPVEFSSFAATLTAQNFVKLTWVTETETGVSGYNVYRSEDADQASAVKINGTLIDATNTSQTQTYNHVDNAVSPETTYNYWLEVVEMDGTTSFHGPTTVYVETPASIVPSLVTTMGNAYPNPFKANSNTNIAYEVKAGETGTITIYNIIGQVVKTVPVKETTAPATFTWNGRDSKGNVCASGIYFYKMSTPSRNVTKKMVIVN